MGVENQKQRVRLFRGARVRMSQLGRERHPKYGYREGVIVGCGSPSSWRVKFDERKTIQAIHRDYLELAPPIDLTALLRHPYSENSSDRSRF